MCHSGIFDLQVGWHEKTEGRRPGEETRCWVQNGWRGLSGGAVQSPMSPARQDPGHLVRFFIPTPSSERRADVGRGHV